MWLLKRLVLLAQKKEVCERIFIVALTISCSDSDELLRKAEIKCNAFSSAVEHAPLDRV